MTAFAVWAPKPDRVEVQLDDVLHPMLRDDRGWWRTTVAHEGSDYAFVLDGGEPRPDPRSAWQPHGVHGPSRIVDHAAFGWTDDDWRGIPLAGSVLYELHVGTFTADGTFDAAVERLDHLCCRATPSTAAGGGATTASRGTPCTTRTAAPTGSSGSSTPATGAASAS